MSVRKLIKLDPDDTARALARVPLFSGCSEEDIWEIASLAHLLRFEDGAVVVPEGEEGLGFYLLMSGEVDVVHDGHVLNHLRAGDFFGEIALLEGTPRTATVIASGVVVCLGILRGDFRPLLMRQPRLALRILEEEGRRVDQAPGAAGVQ
jgi:CRP-like cAMP-binding protein